MLVEMIRRIAGTERVLWNSCMLIPCSSKVTQSMLPKSLTGWIWSISSNRGFTAMHRCETKKWRASLSAHLCETAFYNQRTEYGAEYQPHCVGTDGCNTGILQSLSQLGPMNGYTGTERILYASLSGAIESVLKGDSLIAGHEAWCHHCRLQSKQHSMEGQHENSSMKKFKMQPLAGKVMCIVFSHRKGLILLDFLEPEQITNFDGYI